MPPPTWTGTTTARQMSRIASRLSPSPSAASRSITCRRRTFLLEPLRHLDRSIGVRGLVARSPRRRRTARPPRRSIAGITIIGRPPSRSSRRSRGPPNPTSPGGTGSRTRGHGSLRLRTVARARPGRRRPRSPRRRMDEVEPRPVGDPLDVRVRRVHDLVPSDVWHLDLWRQSARSSGEDAQPIGSSSLCPSSTCPHADAEDRRAAARVEHRGVEPERPDRADAVTEVPDARMLASIGPEILAGRASLQAPPPACGGTRVEVPTAVVEHGDLGHGP